MQKINYFELLEEIALLSTRAVFLTSSGTRQSLQRALTECQELQNQCIEKVLSLEECLFTDFLPPLERRSIAEAAHGMAKIIDSGRRKKHQRNLKVMRIFFTVLLFQCV